MCRGRGVEPGRLGDRRGRKRRENSGLNGPVNAKGQSHVAFSNRQFAESQAIRRMQHVQQPLEIIVGGDLDPETRRITAPTRIYWGRPDGRPDPLQAGVELGKVLPNGIQDVRRAPGEIAARPPRRSRTTTMRRRSLPTSWTGPKS